jgi:ABC-type antimicrobial peptide transport system permease subunit
VFDYKTIFSRVTLETTSLQPRFWDRWDHASASLLFVRLSPGITPANTQKQITALFAKYNHPNYEDNVRREFDMRPLKEAHFKSYYDSNSPGLADKSILYGLLAVAGFLLALACINFINLTTAQSAGRAKEIGIRKTLGSNKIQLRLQFLGETFLLTLLATIISCSFTPMLLKAFATFIPQGVKFNPIQHPGILLFITALIVVVSSVAGLYPAAVLSSFKPVLVLKGNTNAGTGQTRNAWLRKSLTVSQFVIAQAFIIATLLVSKQINYALNKDMGIRKNAVINLMVYQSTPAKRLQMLDKLKTITGIEMISLSMDAPSNNSTWIDAIKYNDGKKETLTDVQVKIGDSNYIKLYEIKLLAGKNLTVNDSMGSLLINETYLHALGYTNPHDVIGKYVDDYGKKQVIGVVRDFNQKSLREAITPLLITGGIYNEYTFNIALKQQSADGSLWKTTIGKIEAAFKQVYPKNDFSYSFLDDSIAAYYTAEQNVSTLLMWSTGLTIFISCLGLLGLVIFVTNQRTREIGVRKVIGASVGQLVALLSKDFLKLIIIGFAIAVPFAWWGANSWLQNFAYKTSLSWWVFASGGLIMLALAFIVLSVRTFKVASANPVKSLRTE